LKGVGGPLRLFYIRIYVSIIGDEKEGQVFVFNSTKTDGSMEREYYVSNGKQWKGMDATQQLKVMK
jgi:hypothetical protein